MNYLEHCRCHDIQHIGTQYNDAQHNLTFQNSRTLLNVMLSFIVVMLSVTVAEYGKLAIKSDCYEAKCAYIEC